MEPGPGTGTDMPVPVTLMFSRWHCARRISRFTRVPGPARNAAEKVMLDQAVTVRVIAADTPSPRCNFLLCATCMLPSPCRSVTVAATNLKSAAPPLGREERERA